MDQGKQFSDYKLDDHLKKTLDGLGFERSTPIQDKAIPLVVNGKDVAGLAQTGTGKTAAFLLPLIERVLRSGQESIEDEELKNRAFTDWQPGHFNLVLVPTRELAEQVKDCAVDFLKGTEHRVVTIYGGVSSEKQIEAMAKGFTFLVATPGRLIDHYKENRIDLKQVRSVTFDEADRMFDMGFKDDMKYILRRIPEERQLLLFSATLNLDVFNVAYQFGSDPVEIKVSQDQMTADNVDDFIFHVGRDEKASHLLGVIAKHKPKQVIIFTNFKSNVDRVSEFLNKNGHKAGGISSLLSQSQRKRVMDRFRADDGENILVATDVAARGLDIEGVDLVINYELPDDAENYVHRIGRTGRAGEKGKAYSFVSDKDVEALDRIKKYLDREVEAEWLDDEELPKDFSPFPRGELMMNRSRTRDSRGGGRGGDKRRSSGGKRDDKRRDRDRKPSDRKASDRDDKKKDYKKSDKKRSRKKDDETEERGSGKKRVHRDKRSGRHKSKGDDKRSGENKKRSRSESSKSSDSNKKKRPNRNNKKRSSARAKKPTSVLGKITKTLKGFFK